MESLDPFVPGRDGPWDREAAAHLARRAGFGAHGEELERLVELGPEGAVAYFVDFESEDPALEQEIAEAGPELDTTPGAPGEYGDGPTGRLRRWWLYRMVRGRYPLREKLTLFWHDHFATQESVVIRTPILRLHNHTLRAHAGGSFRALLGAVARDPAMLVYLDNRLSTKESPNENWARELVELFTLGVDRYTQGDVKALARIFTGWTTPRPDATEFFFDPDRHDSGDKLLFGEPLRGRAGEAGIEEGDEALDRILARPDAAPFLARKLLTWFASPAAPDAVVEALSQRFVETGGSIAATLECLFASRWFQAPEQRRALVKTPVDLVVGAARAVEMRQPHRFGLEEHLRRLGMNLFEPPSVNGWSHGPAWIGTGSAAPRLNFALDLSNAAHAARDVVGRSTVDLDALAESAGDAGDAQTWVRGLAQRLLGFEPTADQLAIAARVLDEEGPEPDSEREARSWRRARTRAALHVVFALPQAVLA